MNTIKSLIYAAETKKKSWEKTINDPVALEKTGKTRDEAIALINYFEGKYDAYLDVLKFSKNDNT